LYPRAFATSDGRCNTSRAAAPTTAATATCAANYGGHRLLRCVAV